MADADDREVDHHPVSDSKSGVQAAIEDAGEKRSFDEKNPVKGLSPVDDASASKEDASSGQDREVIKEKEEGVEEGSTEVSSAVEVEHKPALEEKTTSDAERRGEKLGEGNEDEEEAEGLRQE